jgi:hypothetical protein
MFPQARLWIATSLMLLAMMFGASAPAAAVDDVADALVAASGKAITPESLARDFARLTRFVRHDAPGMVLFTDGGSTDGYVRHAQAHFDTAPAIRDETHPLFTVALELVDQPGFTYAGLSDALLQRLGLPYSSGAQIGATFRTWRLRQPAGRILTVARSVASDNGDGITVIQLTQER